MKSNCTCEEVENAPLKQVIVVREDIAMSPAKLAVQVAHGCIGALDETDAIDARQWKINGMKKIVLAAESEDEIIELYYRTKAEGLPCFLVVEMGLTEFNGPTITSFAIGPASEDWVDSLTGNHKLYKGERTEMNTEVQRGERK